MENSKQVIIELATDKQLELINKLLPTANFANLSVKKASDLIKLLSYTQPRNKPETIILNKIKGE